MPPNIVTPEESNMSSDNNNGNNNNNVEEGDIITKTSVVSSLPSENQSRHFQHPDQPVEDLQHPEEDDKKEHETQERWERQQGGQLAWRSTILILSLHLLSAAGCWVLLIGGLCRATIVWTILWGIGGGLGVTAGAHRLWAHRSYSARRPLRILLMILFTVAGENDIYEWTRDHRLHHRHSETDADPHNARRGFFFAHCGWLMVRKHPEVMRQGAKTDLSDLLRDPVVRFQRKYYLRLVALFTFAIPTLVPVLVWGESLLYAFLVAGCFKYTCTLHCTWLVNSAAHMWGMHPYEEGINPAENHFVAFAALGEGWHNYHHVFPWDYRAAELPGYVGNLTTGFIDFFSTLGWAYNFKTASPDLVARRAVRTGDGSWNTPKERRRSAAKELLLAGTRGTNQAAEKVRESCVFKGLRKKAEELRN